MSESTEMVPVRDVARASDFMPLFDINQAVERQKAMSEFIGKILHEGGDYGVIPGTNKQKVLLKPGAEKLCTFFGLSTHFEAETIIEDWTGKDQGGGEPLFYYRYKCQLYRGDRFIAEAVGSCNSREKKYRYRGGERKCPQCDKATIIKGKAEYGGGWLCFAKKGGCGAKFAAGDPSIEGQEVGQVVNPDIADSVNTIQKIAQKRALVAAVLIGTNASDSFTQDLEEELERTEPGKTETPAEPDEPELAKLLESLKAAKDAEARMHVIEGVYFSIGDVAGDKAAKEAWAVTMKEVGDLSKKPAAAAAFLRHLFKILRTEQAKAQYEASKA